MTFSSLILHFFVERFNMKGNVRKRKNEVHSSNHSCSGKEITITYFGCVSLDLDIQHAVRMRSIVLLPVACFGCSTFVYIIS